MRTGGLGQFSTSTPPPHELRGHPVAERDRSSFIEQQRIDVAGRSTSPDIASTLCCTRRSIPAIRSRKQSADRRRNQAYQQRHQHRQPQLRPAIQPERVERDDTSRNTIVKPDSRMAERDFVRVF